MTSSKQKVVRIDQVSSKKVLSKAQKLFNSLIKKIDTEKKLLLTWQEYIPHYHHKISTEYDLLWDDYNAQRIEMVYALDKAYENKIFKKTDKAKIRQLLLEISSILIGEHGLDKLKELHNKHSNIDYDKQQMEADEAAATFLKTVLQNMYDQDLENDLDLSSPEKIQALLQEKFKDLHSASEIPHQSTNNHGNRKKTTKQLANETRKQQEEQNISLSIREVYRKLTSALHPDREQDSAEKLRKTEIMQQVNAAYAKKDLLKLLELQLQAEQIDQFHLNNIAEDRLKNFNIILKEQFRELQQEIAQIQLPFRLELGIPSHVKLSPQYLAQHLQREMSDMRSDIVELKQELKIFQNPASLKAWLKTYRLSKSLNSDHFFQDNLFFDDTTEQF